MNEAIFDGATTRDKFLVFFARGMQGSQRLPFSFRVCSPPAEGYNQRGFERIGTDCGFTNARGKEIEEIIFRLL